MTPHEPAEKPKPMLWFALDRPNLISLLGLMSALGGIYFAIVGVFPAAMIGLIWAVVFDWLDGSVARRMKNRTGEQAQFGAQLDSLIDVVSFGVAPAVVLVSVGGFAPQFLPGAAIIVAASVIRLAYFNVFGLVDTSTYRGLALDNNVIILVTLFTVQGQLNTWVFAGIAYVVLMSLAILNVADIRTPKLGGAWLHALITYALVMSAFYGWRLLA
jgi:CDP-diacylglycerol---serine O-phosphatidyltransferase